MMTSHMLVTRPVNLAALRHHLTELWVPPAVADRVAQSWKHKSVGPFTQHDLRIRLQGQLVIINVLHSPDGPMLDPGLVENPVDPEPWLPPGHTVFADVMLEAGGPFGSTRSERLLNELFPNPGHPGIQSALMLHRVFLRRLGGWLMESGCETAPWQIWQTNDPDWHELGELSLGEPMD